MIDFKKLPESSLKLFNQYGETYEAGDITTFITNVSKAKVRWSCPEPMNNKSPFTHAMVYKGRTVFSIAPIIPFEPGSNPREVELEFAK